MTQVLRAGAAKSTIELRLFAIALATVPFVAGGVSLLIEAGGGIYWVLGGTVAAVIVGVLNAWVLLVEILR